MRALLVLPVVLLLAACTTGGGGTGGGTGGGSDGGGSSSGADCSAFDSTEVAPFSSSMVVTPPAEGSVWGDGTTLSFEVTPEASALIPQARFFALTDDGVVVDAASTVLTDEGGNVWDTNLNLFDDDLEGQAGIVELLAVSDQTFDGAKNEGQSLIMGRYCVTFKN